MSLSVGLAEDSRRSRNPETESMAYTIDCLWQNRSGFIRGREEIISLLTRNRTRELDDRPVKELWAFEGSGMDARFACRGQDDSGQWYRSCGNGNRESVSSGRRAKRIAGNGDLPVRGSDFLRLSRKEFHGDTVTRRCPGRGRCGPRSPPPVTLGEGRPVGRPEVIEAMMKNASLLIAAWSGSPVRSRTSPMSPIWPTSPWISTFKAAGSERGWSGRRSSGSGADA